jgi:hypothetical protein
MARERRRLPGSAVGRGPRRRRDRLVLRHGRAATGLARAGRPFGELVVGTAVFIRHATVGAHLRLGILDRHTHHLRGVATRPATAETTSRAGTDQVRLDPALPLQLDLAPSLEPERRGQPLVRGASDLDPAGQAGGLGRLAVFTVSPQTS